MITEKKFSRQRYRTALEENKKKREEDATVGDQMKRNAMNEFYEFKKKKAKLVGEKQEELAIVNSGYYRHVCRTCEQVYSYF